MQEIILQTEHPRFAEIMRQRPICLTWNLAELLTYFGKDCSVPYCEMLTFEYEADEKKGLSKRIKAEYKITDVYQRYGLQIEKKLVGDVKEYLKYLTDKITDGTPVIIHFDRYYLEWDPHYQKDHNEHTVLLTGISDGGFYISDSFYGKSAYVTEEKLLDASKYYYDMDKGSIQEQKNGRHRAAYRDKYERLNAEQYYERGNALAEDLRDFEKSRDDREDPDKYLPELIQKIEAIETNKHRFNSFLQEWEQHEGHSRYSASFKQVLTDWQIFRSLMFKSWLSGYKSESMRHASEYLKKLLGREKVFCESLAEGEAKAVSAETHFETETAKAGFLQLCNNKGLSTEIYDPEADCTGLGEYVCIGSELQNLEKLGYRIEQNGDSDNIKCEGQSLKFEEQAKEIKMLCTAEWGSFDIEFIVEYEDGSREKKPAVIEDWSIFGEMRLKIGSSYRVQGGIAEKCCGEVYADEIKICGNEKSKPKRVELPNCPNVHVIAVQNIRKGEKDDE